MKKIEIVTVEHRRSVMRSAVLRLLSFMLIGTSVVTPSLLWARTDSPWNPLREASQQAVGSENPRQAPSQSTVPNANGRSGNNRPAAQPQQPRNGVRPQDRPPRPRPEAGPRPPRNGGPGHNHPRPPVYQHPHYGPRRPTYVWGGGNGWRLRHFFLGDAPRMQRWHRNRLFTGAYFPAIYLENIQPVPPSLMEYLPPIPMGYEVGYYDGYCLIYDPGTLRIVSVIDLYLY